MHILRNLILLSAGAAAILVFRHGEEIQQLPHASLPSIFTWTESQFRTVRTAEGSDQILFSPTEDIERVDVDLMDHAQATIRVAMFAFTDRAIAQALARAAARGGRFGCTAIMTSSIRSVRGAVRSWKCYQDKLQFMSE